jgi:diguanylate cyclase (GGDEF)-like protein
MIRVRQPRRSIVFQLWARLSAVTVSFTLLALAFYVWVEINDSIEAAQAQSIVRANAIATAVARIGTSGSLPTPAELAIAATLGVEGVQFLDGDGNVTAAFGRLDGDSIHEPAAVVEGDLLFEQGTEVRLDGSDFGRTQIGVLDLLRGGEYGTVHVYPFPPNTIPGGMRIVMGYDDLAGSAKTMLLRSLALASTILAVAVIAMWLLLYRFVARPLRDYSATARRIAAGEPLRLPDNGNNELGQLGQAINGMADILRYQASIDSLTGLYNVRHLTGRLESLVEEARERKESLTLLVCDLDNLKPVNDTYGHHIGDLLLRSVARHLTNWAGVECTCWRTGGDEFAAAIPGQDPEAAKAKAAELERTINSATMTVPGGDFVRISLSVGVATYPEDGTTGAAIMNAADLRMYAVKSRKAKPSLPAPAA